MEILQFRDPLRPTYGMNAYTLRTCAHRAVEIRVVLPMDCAICVRTYYVEDAVDIAWLAGQLLRTTMSKEENSSDF